MADGSSLRWTALAAFSFAVAAVGLVAAFSVAPWHPATRTGRRLALVAIVAGVVGACCWYAVVERPDSGPNPRRSAVAGALVGLLGPWVFFAGWSLVRNATVLATDPLGRAGVALLVGPLALVKVGPLTLPLGATTGYLLGRRRGAENSAAAAEGASA